MAYAHLNFNIYAYLFIILCAINWYAVRKTLISRIITENRKNKDKNMSETKRISSALISVFHKDGLDEINSKLHQEGVKLISTGGTQRFIESLGVPCQAVEELTGYPSILGGRVKTLHPKVFGGILARREEENDMAQMASYDIPEIDLVIVDLYPFEDTVKSGAEDADIIEKIDIGGISLIRAGAKNFKDSVVDAAVIV